MASLPPPQNPPTLDSTIPSYIESTLNDDVPSVNDSASLPAYPGQRPVQRERRSAPRLQKEFSYRIDRNEHTWACMTIAADEKLSKALPTFVEGDPIKGQVELWTEKGGDDIRGVVADVMGEVIMGASPGERFTFLHASKTLWSREMGDPRKLYPTTPRSTERSDGPNSHPQNGAITPPAAEVPVKFNQKLVGHYVWKFELNLPKHVSITNGKEMGTYRLPQTQSERYTRACVRYEVSIRFLRGKLRSDNKIGAVFGFIPIIYPPPFSPLRQLAYQEGLPNLLGPNLDPEGWHSGEPICVKGKIFNNREIVISCQLYLAKPLSYTRGTAIPMQLVLVGGDTQALDLLSNPKAPVVRLRRRVRNTLNAEKDLRNMVWRDSIAQSKVAVWWHGPDLTEGPHDARRTINGELHLKPDLKPTSAVAQFRMEYSVVLFPFDVAGFESFASDPLLEQPVDIVTAYAAGARPRMLTPPGYDYDDSLHSMEQSNVLAANATIGFL